MTKMCDTIKAERRGKLRRSVLFQQDSGALLARLPCVLFPWWRHEMETFSALLAICAGNSPAIGEFPTQRPVTRNFDVFLDLRLNKRLSKQPWGCWFETLSWSLWRQRNAYRGFELLLHPPYSYTPHLACSDYYLFFEIDKGTLGPEISWSQWVNMCCKFFRSATRSSTKRV